MLFLGAVSSFASFSKLRFRPLRMRGTCFPSPPAIPFTQQRRECLWQTKHTSVLLSGCAQPALPASEVLAPRLTPPAGLGAARSTAFATPPGARASKAASDVRGHVAWAWLWSRNAWLVAWRSQSPAVCAGCSAFCVSVFSSVKWRR